MIKKMSDSLRVWIHQHWVELFNDDKFMVMTVHNDARDNYGVVSIQLTSPWKDQPKDHYYKAEKTIFIDSVEKFLKLYKALLEMED
jgi:hypothetical protein